MSLTLILLAVLIVFWLRWRHKNRRLLAMASAFPGPPALPFIGNALSFIVQPEELAGVVGYLMTRYGAALRFWLGPDLNIIVSDPSDLKVLLTSTKTSSKGPQYKYMADIIGGGILSGSGPTWRKHRKLAMPNYGKRAIESYNDVVNEEIDLLLETLRGDEAGLNCNIYTPIVKATSYMVCQALMGLSREQTMELPYLQELIDITPKMYDAVFDRMTRWYLQIDPLFWLTDRYQTQKSFIKMSAAFCTTIIRHREEALRDLKDDFRSDRTGMLLKTDPKTASLLLPIEENRCPPSVSIIRSACYHDNIVLSSEFDRSALMKSKEDSLMNTELSVIDRFVLSHEMNAEELNQETFTIFTSSQEASAKISSALLLMMACHPECQEKLYEEISSIMGDEDRWISDEDLKRMPYLDMVFSEAIRLFPIGAMIQRTIKEDITISSGTLPAGSSLTVPVYHIQRDPRFWKNPDAFDPERFSPENMRLRHPNCFLPFSLGPMDCLGRYFGKKLIKMICVRMLREFKLTSSESYKDLKLSIAISASPIDGYNVILNRRN